MNDQSISNINSFSIDQIDFDVCLAPLELQQVNLIASTFFTDPELYSSKLLTFYIKKGINILRADGWEQIYKAIINYQKQYPLSDTPIMYQFASTTLIDFYTLKGNASYYSQIIITFLNEIVNQYIENTNETKLDSIYSVFYKLFRSLTTKDRSRVVSYIFKKLKDSLTINRNEIHILGSLRFSYTFITDYEALIDLTNVGPQRHKTRDNFIYFNKEKMNSLFPIKINHDEKIFTFNVDKNTLISDIALAIGVHFKTEYTNVNLFLQNQRLNNIYTVDTYKLNNESIIKAQILNCDTYDYSQYNSFLSLVINNDKQETFFQILSLIKDDNILSVCSSEQIKNSIIKYSWNLLKVIPSYQPLLENFQNIKYAFNILSQEKTELSRRYDLQIINKIYRNDETKSEIGKQVIDQIKQRKFSENELRDAYEILKTYYRKNSSNAYDTEFIFTLCDTIVTSDNDKLCSSALSLLQVLKENAEIEKYIISNRGILERIMKHGNYDLKPFFKSFRLRKDLFNILKELINDFSSDERKKKRLFGVLKDLITSQCDTRDTFLYVLANLRSAKSDLLVEYIEFFLNALEAQPSLLSNTTKNDESFAIVDYLFNFITNINLGSNLNNLDDYSLYEDSLQAVSLKIFIVLCKNDDSVKKKILSKMNVMSNVQCPRWNYTPETFKKSSNGYCGLRNLGSTCYMNSIIQQLFFNDDCRRATLGHKGSDNKFVDEMRSIFIKLALSNQASVDTEHFASIWKEEDPSFSTRVQEDAEEFFHRLTGKLPKDVTSTFEGVMTSSLKGIDVEFSKEVVENFNFIPIPVKGYKSFVESVPTVYNPQMFTENNQYRDDQLGNIDVKMTMKIDSLPKTIVFLLKRFDYNVQTKRRVKITNEFFFPLFFEAGDYFPDQTGYYSLKGVITHSGTAEGGHYNALVRRGKRWIDFDDTESRNITMQQFNEFVQGNEKLENARCAYLLFYEKKESEEEVNNESETNIIDDIKKYMQDSELEKITSENNNFSIMQAAFERTTADFALNSNDLLFMFNYFINVLCHSTMVDLADAFSKKILKYLDEQRQTALSITNDLAQSPVTIFEITKSAPSQFRDSICLILSDLFTKVPYKLSFSVVDYIVKNIKESISVWKALPFFAKIIHSYLKVGKDNVKVGNENKWGLEIMDCMHTFYSQSLSSYALSSIDFSDFFRSLEVLYTSGDQSQLKLFVSQYGKQIEESKTNLDAFRSLKDMVYGIKQAQNATSRSDIFCSYLLSLKDFEIINQSIEKCGKTKTWVIDAFISFSITIAPLLFKYEVEVLLPLLTDEQQTNRDKAEELVHKLFNSLPELDGYQKADLLLLGHSHVNVYDRRTAMLWNKKHIRSEVKYLKEKNSQKKFIREVKQRYRKSGPNSFTYVNKEAERFLTSTLQFIGANYSKLANRMSNLFRIVHWLKVRLGSTDISNLREVLSFVGFQPMSPNLDLIELFHLYQTFTEDQFDTFFKECNLLFMQSLSPNMEVNDRVARFIMFITLLTTPEQYTMCLNSPFFFVAYSYLLQCPLPQPFCYMAGKFCSILCRPRPSNNNDNNAEDDVVVEEEEVSDSDGSIGQPTLSKTVEMTTDLGTLELERPKPVHRRRRGDNDDEYEEEEEDNNEDEDDEEANAIASLLNEEEDRDDDDDSFSKDEQLTKEDTDMIVAFADFLFDHADYSFFTPQTNDGHPCFIPVLDEIKRFFTPALTSKCISQYFICFSPDLLEHPNAKEFTRLITKLPSANSFSVTLETATKMMKTNFSGIVIARSDMHSFIVKLASSSLEFSDAFAAEFELFVSQSAEYADFYRPRGQDVERKSAKEGSMPRSPIEDEQVCRLSEVYMLTATKPAVSNEVKSHRVAFLVLHFFDSAAESLAACVKFAKSKHGKKCIKLVTSMLDADQDEIFNATIELFGFLTGNKIPIVPEVEEFLKKYLEHLDIYDLDIESLANSINSAGPDLRYSLTLLNVYFKAKSELKEYFLETCPINQDVLDNWPPELAQYRNLFII